MEKVYSSSEENKTEKKADKSPHITTIRYSLKCGRQSDFLGQDACGAQCSPISQCCDVTDVTAAGWRMAFIFLCLPKPSSKEHGNGQAHA